MARDTHGNLPIQIACLEGKCNVVKYLSATFGHENSKGKLPIELLLYEAAGCDRDSIKNVKAFGPIAEFKSGRGSWSTRWMKQSYRCG